MAVAEARAAWQRTANRCFVQEDAKRAPKLACCQSSSSSSKQVDGETTNAADMPEHSAVGVPPLHRHPSYSNIPPDTRWWLQVQSGYGYQKVFTYDQLNKMEAEIETLRTEIVNSSCMSGDIHSHNDPGSIEFSGDKKLESPFHSPFRVPAGRRSEDFELKNQEARSPPYCKYAEEDTEFRDTSENSKLADPDPFECFGLKNSDECCFDSELPFLKGEKSVPWWRTTDRDDLASLVAQKSLDYIANCDLPPPQKRNVKRCLHGRPEFSDHDDALASSLDCKARSGGVSTSTVAHGYPGSECMYGSHIVSVEGHLQSASKKSFSSTPIQRDVTEFKPAPEGDPCKAQLLEALRHSQTRAREAEKVAKQICAEKEHIIKLFFRQASQLFAYKQWLRLLQLESLYYQVKNGGQPMSTLFPLALPWMPRKGRKPGKKWQKSAKGKHGKHGRSSNDISKYAVALALGLGLVGAGLLLGWTVGWMLPI